MKELLQRLVTLVTALVSGTIIGLPLAVIGGMMVPPFVLNPLSFGFAALLAAFISSQVAGLVTSSHDALSRVDCHRAQRRIFAVSEATALVAAVGAVLLLTRPVGHDITGPLQLRVADLLNIGASPAFEAAFVFALGIIPIALSANWASWHYYGRSVGRSRGALARGVMTQVVLVGLAVFVEAGVLYSFGSLTGRQASEPSCDPEEQAVLEEFPLPQYKWEEIKAFSQYEMKEKEVQPPNSLYKAPSRSYGCEAQYQTQVDLQQDYGYFQEQLAANGWTLEVSCLECGPKTHPVERVAALAVPDNSEQDTPETTQAVTPGGYISARRDNFAYEVLIRPHPNPEREDTYTVQAAVWEKTTE